MKIGKEKLVAVVVGLGLIAGGLVAADASAAPSHLAALSPIGFQSDSSGRLDDGTDLLPQAKITLDQAIVTAQGAAKGDVGEIDLETIDNVLVFNVDIGDNDVQVDATTGSIVDVVTGEDGWFS